MHYAINLYDLLNLQQRDPIASLLFSKERLGDVITVKRDKPGEDAIRLLCSEDQNVAIIELIRKKYKKYQCRLYQSKTGKGGWKRI